MCVCGGMQGEGAFMGLYCVLCWKQVWSPTCMRRGEETTLGGLAALSRCSRHRQAPQQQSQLHT